MEVVEWLLRLALSFIALLLLTRAMGEGEMKVCE